MLKLVDKAEGLQRLNSRFRSLLEQDLGRDPQNFASKGKEWSQSDLVAFFLVFRWFTSSEVTMDESRERFNRAWEQLNFDNTPLLDTQRPLMFKDAHTTYKTGMPGTAQQQARSFLAFLKKYTSESAVFRELIVEIVEKCKEQEVILYFGK